ncbi:50S ribosomal protein L23 [bioreactor metagenome]|uniref:50S ribosomal protein L23 n=1 Tax=bioreactor metagenome TaxID=1076179 RepID=A0A645EQY3_9ZZZZ
MISSIINLKPIVTEKSLGAQEIFDKYSFWVDCSINKNQIRSAFVEVFGVKPISINTVVSKGKLKTDWKNRKPIQKPNKKKAIITLPKGTKLELLKIKTK